jgi:AraC family transcriptional regulator of adaptative response/methylated-DNA-[protein]-cysteine methyltransferase
MRIDSQLWILRSEGCWWARPRGGIRALYLGESDAALESALRKEYLCAQLLAEGGAAESLKQCVGEILADLRGQEPSLDLPTDVQATAFRRRVWEELRRSPYGTTRATDRAATGP